MTPEEIESLDWAKGDGLLPAIVQDAASGVVLMTGYVNKEALASMQDRGEVVLWSRTRRCLWIKGETSGNRIAVERIVPDCDRDALLVLGRPVGPSCHTGATSCFPKAEPEASALAFVCELESIVVSRLESRRDGSYTSRLAASGIRRIAQKVGEEAIEVALAATATEEELLSEAADLVYHLIVLLKIRDISLAQVSNLLMARHAGRPLPAN